MRSQTDYSRGIYIGKCVSWSPSQLGAQFIVRRSFITALNTEKNRKSENQSGEKEQSHAYGRVSIACHRHGLISHLPCMQLHLSYPSSLPFAGVENSKGLSLHAIFLRSQWKCCAEAPRWIVFCPSQTVLWLSLYQQTLLHYVKPWCCLKNTSGCPQEGETSMVQTLPKERGRGTIWSAWNALVCFPVQLQHVCLIGQRSAEPEGGAGVDFKVNLGSIIMFSKLAERLFIRCWKGITEQQLFAFGCVVFQRSNWVHYFITEKKSLQRKAYLCMVLCCTSSQ